MLLTGFEPSRLKSLLDHLGTIEDPRDPWRVAHPLSEVLFLVVCRAICDCEDYDIISDWGEERIDFLRRYLPYEHGVPGGRWLTILMNRIEPALFAAAFTAWVRETWPENPDFVAIDGKTSRRSHDRAPLKGASAPGLGLCNHGRACAWTGSSFSTNPMRLQRSRLCSIAWEKMVGPQGARVSIDAGRGRSRHRPEDTRSGSRLSSGG
jgi:hypothetical protein